MAESEENKDKPVEAAPTGKSNRRKLVLILVVAVLLVVGAGVPAAYLLFGGSDTKVEELPTDIAADEEDKNLDKGKLEGSGMDIEFGEGEEAIGAIVPFDTFLVNLSGGKYVRIQIQVEFESMDVPSRFYTRMVPIRDGIISLLTQQTADILEDSKGKDRLKMSIRTLMNDALREESVRKIYFTQFVIQ